MSEESVPSAAYQASLTADGEETTEAVPEGVETIGTRLFLSFADALTQRFGLDHTQNCSRPQSAGATGAPASTCQSRSAYREGWSRSSTLFRPESGGGGGAGARLAMIRADIPYKLKLSCPSLPSSEQN
ncbi:hypothetical protein Tcan_16148 [Toxocara canis]|uniref:Uncharacterized protein n=1 Tax=Toxocara canis TaxID=6265 RepID=A0A0B2VVF3_TOXCA|nr:hypothetical protein Tcan_16148 [Toxocara canis]